MKGERILWGLFIGAIILSLLGLLYAITPAHAQGEEQIYTTFEQGCMESVDLTHYKLHIIYTSNGIETYTFTMGDIVGSNPYTEPYKGTATTNIPATFTTSIGTHDDFYLAAQSADSPYQFTLLFTNTIGTAVLPISTWESRSDCPPVEPTPTPQVPTLIPSVPVMDTVRSTGRICVIRYPEIYLICSR